MNLKPEENVPSKQSSASEWVLWHRSMKKAGFGKATANKLWLEAWQQRGCSGVGFGIGCTANTTELREYLESQGIAIEGGTFDFVADTWDEIGDFTSQAFNLTTYAFIAIAVILVAFLGLLAWNVGKNPKLIVDGAKAYAGRGAI